MDKLDLVHMPTGKSWDLLFEEAASIPLKHARMTMTMPQREPSRVVTGVADGIHPIRKIRQSGLYGTFGKNPRGIDTGYDGKLDWTSVGSIFPSDIPPFRLRPVPLLFRGSRHFKKRAYYRGSNVGKSMDIDYAIFLYRGFEDALADKPKVEFVTEFISPLYNAGSATGVSIHANFYDYIGMLGNPNFVPTPYQEEIIKMLGSFAIMKNGELHAFRSNQSKRSK